MDNNWLAVLNKAQLEKVIATNEKTMKYGLSLTPEEAELIIKARNNTLKDQKRVEFGETILPWLIYAFCDSQYIDSSNYADTIARLQDIFYTYKNELLDELNDTELLNVMREMFDEVCYGDLDYLEGSCLNAYSKAVREGYNGYTYNDGHGEAVAFSADQDWRYELFLQILDRG